MKKILMAVGMMFGLGSIAATCHAPVNPPSNPRIDGGIVDAAISDTIVKDAVESNSCLASLAHLKKIGCNPIGPWLAACKVDRQHGMFALDCINQATTKSDAITKCKIDCGD